MALKYIQYNDATGEVKTGPSPGAPVPQHYDVGSGGQSIFNVTASFSADTYMKVYVNGVLAREGTGKDFIRNVTLQLLEFNYTVPELAWVIVEIYG